MTPQTPEAGELFPPELEALWNSRLARRVLGLVRRLRQADRTHPVILDALLALLMFAVGLGGLLFRGGDAVSDALGVGDRAPIALIILSIVGQSVPLIWRRRAPTAVLGVVAACCAFQWWLGLSLRSSIAIMIALYSMARYAGLRRLPWAAAVGVATVGIAAFRAEPFRFQPWTSLVVLCGTVTAAIAVALVVQVRQAQLSALADRAARLETEREQRVRLATFAERSRVSREMHDIVGHNLAVIVGLADGASHGDHPDPARSQEVLKLIASTGRQALSEVRGTLRALRQRPDQELEAAELNPQPGLGDLSALLAAVRATGPEITYRTSGDLDAVTPSVGLAAYRIVQEALTNSLKHAGPATAIDVTVRVVGRDRDRRDLDLLVRDSGGPGGRPGGAAGSPGGSAGSGTAGSAAGGTAGRSGGLEGQGLVGIAERAALAEGRADAGPHEGGGWTVHAVLPLAPHPSAPADPAESSSPPHPADQRSPKDQP